MQARLEERLSERERIARELHDTFLQGVQGLVLHFQSVADKMPLDQPARLFMENALERADDLLVEGRERVKDLREEKAAGDFEQALAQEVSGLSQLSKASFRVTVEGSRRDLHPVARDEIMNIGREAIFNAFRHAEASNIELKLTYQRGQFILTVRDNGVGIDPSFLEKGGREGHFGIAGMRERARQIHARLALTSMLGNGTELTLVVPAEAAYIVRKTFLSRLLPIRILGA